jgi:hypothetical protein
MHLYVDDIHTCLIRARAGIKSNRGSTSSQMCSDETISFGECRSQMVRTPTTTTTTTTTIIIRPPASQPAEHGHANRPASLAVIPAEAPPPPGSLAMCAGDFVEVYSKQPGTVCSALTVCRTRKPRSNLPRQAQASKPLNAQQCSALDCVCVCVCVGGGGERGAGEWDGLLTCFFIDTAQVTNALLFPFVFL